MSKSRELHQFELRNLFNRIREISFFYQTHSLNCFISLDIISTKRNCTVIKKTIFMNNIHEIHCRTERNISE